MQLKEFVQETIEQIVEGVANSKTLAEKHGARVNPSYVSYYKEGKRSTYKEAMPQNVEFDVGLTSTSSDGSAEGIGVFLGSVNLGKRNQTSSEDVAITKVRFVVPVVLPATDTDVESSA
jgi:hypothetical protein